MVSRLRLIEHNGFVDRRWSETTTFTYKNALGISVSIGQCLGNMAAVLELTIFLLTMTLADMHETKTDKIPLTG